MSANEQTELKEERLNENSIKSSVSTVSENPTRQEVNKDKPLEEVALLKEQKIYSIKDFTNLYAKDFSEEELKVWQATDYQGNIDLSKLSEAEKAFLQNSENYVQEKPNKFIHKELFASGNLYEKVNQQRELLDNAFSDNEKAL